jgi:Chaperone for flagella basal body P-ring formation
MATTATAPRTNGRRADERSRPVPSAAATRRHRQAPLVALGVLLVLGCALVFADASVHLGNRAQVLVVAQPVSAGQVLTSGDLRTTRVSTGSGLDVVPVDQEATVLGRRVAVPLVAGSLLTATEVGSAPAVGSGSDVVAVGLKAGAYPPEVAPGDRVQVVPVASGSSGTNTASVASGSPINATVLAVTAAPAASDEPTVFSLQVSANDSAEVAALAAAGQASLVEVGG